MNHEPSSISWKEFFDKLKNLYHTHLTRGKEEWIKESDLLQQIFPQIAASIDFNYQIDKPVGIGGNGIVCIAWDQNLGTKRALKIPRPLLEKEQWSISGLEQEATIMGQVSHQSILKLYARGRAKLEEIDWPWFITDFLEPFVKLDDYIEDSKIEAKDLLRIFMDLAEALRVLHERKLLHCDIKPSNFTVASNRGILVDLGSVQRQDPASNEEVLLSFSIPWASPSVRDRATGTTPASARQRAKFIRSELSTQMDLFPFGFTLLYCWEKFAMLHRETARASRFIGRGLQLIGCRCLGGQNSADAVPIQEKKDSVRVSHLCMGLNSKDFAELRYRNMVEVKRDLHKLLGDYKIELEVPELDEYSPKAIQVSSWTKTPFTVRLSKLIEAPAFQRLARISQLGLLSLVYPNSTHSRFQHALGTYTNVGSYVRALYNDPHNPFFRIIMTREDICAVLLAALLHDLGQYPLAHDLEDAQLAGDPEQVFTHERYTLEMLKTESDLFKGICANLKDIIDSYWDPNDREGYGKNSKKSLTTRIRDILEADPKSTTSGSIKDRLLKTIISGPIDADKLDYLLRDSSLLPAAYGAGIDYGRFLKCLTVVSRQSTDGLIIGLGIHEKGKATAEGIAFARYQMFAQVYWHHTVRSAKTMLHHAVWEILRGFQGGRNKLKNLEYDLMRLILDELDPKAEAIVEKRWIGDLSKIKEFKQIHPRDEEMLYFLINRTTNRGKTLLANILRRRFYKRLLTIPLDDPAGKLVRRFIRKKEIDSERRVGFANDYQNRIITLAMAKEKITPETAAVTPDAFKNLKAISASEFIILVDIPLLRGIDKPLYFVPERDRRLLLDEEAEIEQTKKAQVPEPLWSDMWEELYGQFEKSLGTARVFAHPDIVDLLKARLTTAEIENALKDILENYV